MLIPKKERGGGGGERVVLKLNSLLLLKNVKIDLRENSMLTTIVPGLRSARAETLKPAVYTRTNKNRYKMQDDFINPLRKLQSMQRQLCVCFRSQSLTST